MLLGAEPRRHLGEVGHQPVVESQRRFQYEALLGPDGARRLLAWVDEEHRARQVLGDAEQHRDPVALDAGLVRVQAARAQECRQSGQAWWWPFFQEAVSVPEEG